MYKIFPSLGDGKTSAGAMLDGYFMVTMSGKTRSQNIFDTKNTGFVNARVVIAVMPICCWLSF